MRQTDEPASHPGTVFVAAGGEFEGKGDLLALIAHKDGADAGDADGIGCLDGDNLIVTDESVEGIKNGLGNLDAGALGANGVGLRSGREGDGSGSRDGGRGGFGHASAGAKWGKEEVNSHQSGNNDRNQSNLNQTLA